jgi:hypothetical protein
MTGAEFVASVTEKYCKERSDFTLRCVGEGKHLPIIWIEVQVTWGGKAGSFFASHDALAIGVPKDRIRVNVSHTDAQKMADMLGCRLPTTKISDLIHKAADLKISPFTQKPDARMADTSRMVKHSKDVGSLADASTELVSTVGKDWVLTNALVGKPDRGANYGWHSDNGIYVSSGGAKINQPLGLAHDRRHTDYSQTFRPVRADVLVNGSSLSLDDALRDPSIAPLFSYEGVLHIIRHPGC